MLDLYNKIAKDNGITDELNASPVARLSFIREQNNQLKAIVGRLIFDLTLTYQKLEAAKDDDTKAAVRAKITEYEGQLRQTKEGVKVSNELIVELENTLKED